MSKKKLLIILPAFNEENTIFRIVKKLKKYGNVLVIDDCSSDKTGKNALLAGARVINHKKNFGYETSINTGIKFFLKTNFENLITIDADGQHPTKYVSDIKKLLDKNYDVVCGVRSKIIRLSEKIFIFLSKIFLDLQDPLCGLKGYKRNFLKKYYSKKKSNLICTEYLLLAKKNKFRISEFKIKNKLRKDKSRFGSSLLTEIIILFTFLKILLLLYI